MADRVKVQSLDALREFRTQVCLFTIRAHTALDEIAGETRGMRPWLQEDRFPFWRGQVRDRLRRVADARAALNRSRLSTTKRSHLEEEQEVTAALAALRDAEDKVRVVRTWAKKYESASQPLVGRMYALSHVIEQEMPKAMALLDGLIASLETYLATDAPAASGADAESASDSPTVHDPTAETVGSAESGNPSPPPAAAGAAGDPAGAGAGQAQ
ncbi:MAG: hypothetical protein A3K19_02470 [Lentisphaerae bacterium RIFOXYB12_FULL_65_16]|nr:MAG: hypothetical protein A3K18_27015 [Lentisphaerae bacterium RIFOXYA12_64_32]OGV85128.1 MAG: hypothetical protein A3K19_02470 [Lentisphaerae bacterium RIFOXYB12_FULL_65_16]